jgi:hypothetical protein
VTAPARLSALRRLALPVVVVGLGLGLGACGNSGLTLAKQACSHINRSIALLHESDRAPDQAAVGRLQNQAYDELRLALPLAAQAAYADGQWQSLMTTISESNRVPETTLESALSAQCVEADSSVFGQTPPPPSSIPPPAPAP